MQEHKNDGLAEVRMHIAGVSMISRLGMSDARQQAHVKEFGRLLVEANALCALMGHDRYLSVGPIVVVRHNESDQPAHGSS